MENQFGYDLYYLDIIREFVDSLNRVTHVDEGPGEVIMENHCIDTQALLIVRKKRNVCEPYIFKGLPPSILN